MMMQLLPVLRDSVHTSMYYAKRLLTLSCSLSLSLSLAVLGMYQYGMVYTILVHTETPQGHLR